MRDEGRGTTYWGGVDKIVYAVNVLGTLLDDGDVVEILSR
jgi:hypothetical protein